MKIDNSVKTPGSIAGSPSTRPQAGGTGATNAAAPATQSSSAKVEISALASLGIDSVLANTPVSNADKVAEIKLAIAEGRFKVNPEKIADGLINSVRQLLDKEKSN